MKLLFILVSAVASFVLPFPSLITRYITDSVNVEPSFIFSRGLQVDEQYYYEDLETLNSTITFDLSTLSHTIRKRTAPPSTMWQGSNGYQWTEAQQDVVEKAWAMMLRMAALAYDDLKHISPGGVDYQLFQEQTTLVDGVCQSMVLDKTRTSTKYLICYRTYLAAKNLAYGQLFGADPEAISVVRSRFKRIRDETENLHAIAAANTDGDIYPPRSGTPVFLTVAAVFMHIDGMDLCAKGTEAVAVPVVGSQEFAGNPAIAQNGFIINFCAPFFTMPRAERQLDDLQKKLVSKDVVCNLNNLDSTARVMLHEVTHLPWVINTNYDRRSNPEIYGFYAASYNSIKSNDQGTQTVHSQVSVKNADSYAWMALYNFWNQVKECQGVRYKGPNEAPFPCNTDVWPSTEKNSFGNIQTKPIKSQWKGWTRTQAKYRLPAEPEELEE